MQVAIWILSIVLLVALWRWFRKSEMLNVAEVETARLHADIEILRCQLRDQTTTIGEQGTGITTLMVERDAARKELLDLYRLCDGLIPLNQGVFDKYDAVIAERDELYQERNKLLDQKDESDARIRVLEGERDATCKKLNQFQRVYDSLVEDVDKAQKKVLYWRRKANRNEKIFKQICDMQGDLPGWIEAIVQGNEAPILKQEDFVEEDKTGRIVPLKEAINDRTGRVFIPLTEEVT